MADELRIDPVFEALRQPLGLVEGEERRAAIEAYLEAARLPLERAVFDLMSELVQNIDARTAERYRIRLAYRPGGLALELEEKVGDGDEARWSSMEGDVEKITIRIPAELKDLATQAAARAGTSANTWFVKAMARSLRNMDAPSPPPTWREERHGGRKRMSGWVGGDDER